MKDFLKKTLEVCILILLISVAITSSILSTIGYICNTNSILQVIVSYLWTIMASVIVWCYILQYSQEANDGKEEE